MSRAKPQIVRLPIDRYARHDQKRRITGIIVSKVIRAGRHSDSFITDISLTTGRSINLTSVKWRARKKYGDAKVTAVTVFVPHSDQFAPLAVKEIPKWAADYVARAE